MYEDYEYNLISGLVNFPSGFMIVADKVKPEMFEVPICRDVYQIMTDLQTFTLKDIFEKAREKYNLIDLVALDEYCPYPNKYKLECAGYLMLKAHTERQKQKLVAEATQKGDFTQLADDLKAIEELKFYDDENKPDVSHELMVKAERVARGEKDPHSHVTGYKMLDELIDGVSDGELVILGGRPGSGKTTFALNMAVKMARKHQKVLFFSLEMSELAIHEKVVSILSDKKISQNMSEFDFEKIVSTSRKVKELLPLKVIDKAAVTPSYIYSTCVREKEKNGLDVVFVDHMNIMKGLKSKYSNRYEEVTDISGQLKRLAKDLGVPVICLTQLNRNLESRAIKAPTLADLRESGSIEQDADLVMFVYRPEYHLAQAKPENENSREYYDWEERMEKAKGKAQLILAKNRRGSLGQVDMHFNGYLSQFTEIVV